MSRAHPERELSAWMRAALAGDGLSYDKLLEACARLLKPYFQRSWGRGGLNHVVDDLIQETLLAVHAKRGTYDTARPFLPWLYAIARYKLMDHYRQRPPHDDADLERFAAGAPDLDLSLDLRAALERLPERQRVAVRLTKQGQFTVEEVARQTGLSVPAVKVTVHRALKALRDRLRGGRDGQEG